MAREDDEVNVGVIFASETKGRADERRGSPRIIRNSGTAEHARARQSTAQCRTKQLGVAAVASSAGCKWLHTLLAQMLALLIAKSV